MLYRAPALLACVFGCAAANAQTSAFDAVVSPVQGRGYSAVTGDFNLDGHVDLAMLVSGGGTTTLQIFLGAADGTFHLVQKLALPAGAVTMASGDLDGDGQVDLVIESVQSDRETLTATPKLTLFLGLPDGTYRLADQPVPLPAYNLTPGPWALLNIGDINGDGKADIVFGPHYATDTVPNHSEITVLEGNGDGTFAPAVETLTDLSVFLQGIGGATLAEVTNDGKADLVVTYIYRGAYAAGLDVYAGQTDGTMVRSYTAGPPTQNACNSTLPVTGDFNGDGMRDFAFNPCQGFQITLQQPGHLVQAGVAQAPLSSGYLIAGDLDGDGKLDLVYADGDEIVVLRGDGEGGFQQAAASDLRPGLYAGSAPVPVTVADVNGDGRPDLIVLTDAGIATLLNRPAAPLPQASAAGVVNAATGLAGPLAPGSIVTIYGANLAAETGSPGGRSFGFGAQIYMNSVPMPLLYVSPSQINAQIPSVLAGAGQATLSVARNGALAAPFSVPLTTYSPALFTLDGSGQGAILVNAAGFQSFVAAAAGRYTGSRPAQPGGSISIYGTGLGPLAPNSNSTAQTPVVTIGGVAAKVNYSGMASIGLGLNQVNVTVPDNAPTGDAVALVLTIGAAVSNIVTIAVEQVPGFMLN